jgi:hypothetical protein
MSVEIEGHQVCVVAATQEDAEAARDVLEYMRQRVPIATHNRQLLIGRAGKNIRDIQAKCGLHWMNVSELDVELVGWTRTLLAPCMPMPHCLCRSSHAPSCCEPPPPIAVGVRACAHGGDMAGRVL